MIAIRSSVNATDPADGIVYKTSPGDYSGHGNRSKAPAIHAVCSIVAHEEYISLGYFYRTEILRPEIRHICFIKSLAINVYFSQKQRNTLSGHSDYSLHIIVAFGALDEHYYISPVKLGRVYCESSNIIRFFKRRRHRFRRNKEQTEPFDMEKEYDSGNKCQCHPWPEAAFLRHAGMVFRGSLQFNVDIIVFPRRGMQESEGFGFWYVFLIFCSRILL
jgi:hypothetical protein